MVSGLQDRSGVVEEPGEEELLNNYQEEGGGQRQGHSDLLHSQL